MAKVRQKKPATQQAFFWSAGVDIRPVGCSSFSVVPPSVSGLSSLVDRCGLLDFFVVGNVAWAGHGDSVTERTRLLDYRHHTQGLDHDPGVIARRRFFI